MKTKQTKRADAKPQRRLQQKIVSMEQLLQAKARAKRKDLALDIVIPGPMVALFNAMCEVMGMPPQAYAVYAIRNWITSQGAMEDFDQVVNELL